MKAVLVVAFAVRTRQRGDLSPELWGTWVEPAAMVGCASWKFPFGRFRPFGVNLRWSSRAALLTIRSTSVLAGLVCHPIG